MARDPSKRAFSREVDKTRKRTRAAIARLEKQAAETNNFLIKRQARAQINALQTQLAQISASGKFKSYSAHAQDALRSLQLNKVKAQRELAKQNIDFASEMNKARRGETSILQSKGKERVQLFYKATQPLWEGVPMAERNSAIMRALGVNTISKAFTKVMNQKEVRRTWQQINSSGGVVADTDEMAEAYMQAERTQFRTGSPIELQNARLTEWTKAYGA